MPPKLLSVNWLKSKMQIVQGHDNDVNDSSDAKLLPFGLTELGAPLSTKDSNIGDRQREDCGGWAGARPSGMKRSGKERGERSSGTYDPSRQGGRDLKEGDLNFQLVLIFFMWS